MTDKKFNRHYNNDFNNYNNNSNNTNNSNNVNYNPTIQIKKVEYYENFPRSIENNKIKDDELNHNTNDKIKRKEEKKKNPKNQEKSEILHTDTQQERKKIMVLLLNYTKKHLKLIQNTLKLCSIADLLMIN
jgi:hypothetical protein